MGLHPGRQPGACLWSLYDVSVMSGSTAGPQVASQGRDKPNVTHICSSLSSSGAGKSEVWCDCLCQSRQQPGFSKRLAVEISHLLSQEVRINRVA